MGRRNLIYIVLFFVISISCEKIIDIDIPEKEKKIVINSIISTDSLVKVNVSKSLNILDDKNVIYLNKATVKLYEDDKFIENLTNISNGNFMSKVFYPKMGKNYKIEVSAQNLKTVTAESKIPQKVKITSIDTATKDEEGYFSLEFTLKFDEPENETNYYLLQMKTYQPSDYDFETQTYAKDKLENLYISSDDNMVESIANFGGILFSDKLINGQSYSLKLTVDKYNFYNDTNLVYVYLNSVSKDFYLYLKSYNQHQEAKYDPFAEPVQVYKNIKNGYGIFAGYSSYVDSIEVLGQ